MKMVLKGSLAAAAALLVASPAFAQANATSATTTTTTDNSRTAADSDFDDVGEQNSRTSTTTTTSAAAPVVAPAPATAVIVTEQPKTTESSVRLIPALGSSSFANDNEVQGDNFRGLTAALFADFGKYDFSFETGVETFASRARASDGSASVNINSWGIPLYAKWNMSGKPQETVYLKAGALPFVASGGDTNGLDVMGVAGIGGHIPLGHNSALMLDATYNRLVNDDGVMTNYQGIALLGGLSVNL